MASEIIEYPIGQYTVYDNVATTVFSRNFPANSFARIYVQGAAVRANGDHRSFYRSTTCVRGAGSPSLGTVTDIHTPLGNAGSAAWNLTFALSGNEAQIQVTGQDLAATVWMLQITVFFFREDT